MDGLVKVGGVDVGQELTEAEVGNTRLKAHLRELHLFSSLSPDGQEFLCQVPAGCLSFWSTHTHTHICGALYKQSIIIIQTQTRHSGE